jgi:hypothetical protein
MAVISNSMTCAGFHWFITATHCGDHKVQDFICMDQFLTMTFAQLTYRESLRDIEVNLRAQAKRLYHMGFMIYTSIMT